MYFSYIHDIHTLIQSHKTSFPREFRIENNLLPLKRIFIFNREYGHIFLDPGKKTNKIIADFLM